MKMRGVLSVILPALLLIVVAFHIFKYFRLIHAFAKQYRKMKRRWRDECIVCGYNLRGNTSGICPECGVAVKRM